MERLKIMKESKQCTFKCSKETWKQFKLICLVDNVSCQNKLNELIEDFIGKKKNRKKFKNNIQRVSAS